MDSNVNHKSFQSKIKKINQNWIQEEAVKNFLQQQTEKCSTTTRPEESDILTPSIHSIETINKDVERVEEEDTAVAAWRETRLKELKAKKDTIERLRQLGHGKYSCIQENELLPTLTSCPRVVCHFFHKEFSRCQKYHDLLAILATQFTLTRFVQIEAQNALFFCQKLKIQTLPVLALFKNGNFVHKLVGFDSIPGGEICTAQQLAKVLKKFKVLDDEGADSQSSDEE